jgi:hypothetical protein
MNAKAAKPTGRKSKRRRARKRAAPRTMTKTFRDGSAVILDPRGGIIGLIEARTPYRVRRRTKPKRASA